MLILLFCVMFYMEICLAIPNSEARRWRNFETRVDALEARLVRELRYTTEEIVSLEYYVQSLNETYLSGLAHMQLMTGDSDICRKAESKTIKTSEKDIENVKNTMDYIKEGVLAEKKHVRESMDGFQKQINEHSTSLDDIKTSVIGMENLLRSRTKTVDELENRVQHLIDNAIETLKLAIQNRITASIKNLENGITKSCSSGWTQFKSSCYLLITAKVTWHQANKVCEQTGAHLPELYDLTDSIFIRTMASGDFDIWLGGNDIAQEGTFMWVHSGTAVRYANWGSGQPNNHDNKQDCMTSGYTKNDIIKWQDDDCSERKRFVCQTEI